MNSVTLKGTPASYGVAPGIIYVLDCSDARMDLNSIEKELIEKELDKLDMAVEKTLEEISAIRDGFKGHSCAGWDIFEVYSEILTDKFFIGEIKNIISHEKISAENAVYKCIERYVKELESSNNEYAKQRIFDLNDISSRLINNLSGKRNNPSEIIAGSYTGSYIVIVKKLTPSIAATLCRKRIRGVAAAEGAGFLTHSAIILRGAGIPAVDGINFDEARGFAGEFAVINGTEGILIIKPDQKILGDCEKQYSIGYTNGFPHNEVEAPALTADGHRIRLAANISSFLDFKMAKNCCVDGIGLVRTEMLYINRKRMPDEERQFKIYSRIAKAMGERPVVIRTANIKGDETFCFRNSNGFQSSFKRDASEMSCNKGEELAKQLRAILKASRFGNISISFPMITNSSQMAHMRKLIKRIRGELAGESIDIPANVRIGAVIETVDAVDELDGILEESDFISLGTNDLMADVLKTDRYSTRFSSESYFKPEFLIKIKYCIDKAKEKGRFVSVCGEMAADPRAVKVLIGLGVDELSVSPARLSEVRHIIRNANYAESKEFVEKIKGNNTLEFNEKTL